MIKDVSIRSISSVANEVKEELPSEFYVCYECLGKGQVYQGSFSYLCNICKGKGRLDHNHKYVQRLNQLFKCSEVVLKKQEESIFEEIKVE